MKHKLCVILSAAFAAAAVAGIIAACAPESNNFFTEGFVYARSEDDSGYVVTGLGSEIEVEENGKKVKVNSNKNSAEKATDKNKEMYTHVSIPATYDGRPVVGIAEEALKGHDELVEVVLPEGMLSLGARCFAGCSSLESIVLPDSLKSVGEEAFADLRALASVTLGSGLEEIGKDVFAGSGVASLTVREGLKSIGEGMFRGVSLTELTLPEGVVSLGKEAFADCRSLGYVDGRLDLSKIVLPSTLTSIGTDAFDGAYFLGQIPDAVKYAGNHLLAADPARTTGSVTVKAGTVCIADRAFDRCELLTAVNFPASLVSVGKQAFAGCSSLESITAEEGVYTAAGNCLLEKATNTLVLGCAGSVIPATAEHIGDCAFFGCSRLEQAALPAGLLSIGDSAFYGCEALGDVALPAGLESIGAHAFEGCKGFETVTLPEKIVRLAQNAFAFCENLKDLVLPAGFASFGENSFAGCYDLEHIYFRGSQEAWKDVLVLGEENDTNLNKREILYFYAADRPAAEGNFWHDEGGRPTPWDN